MNKKTVRDVSVKSKRVLVRCDFNVPIDSKTGKITSDKRIVESLKTIKYLINAGAKVILCSHIGKTGQNKSLLPVSKRLAELLQKDVLFIEDIFADSTKDVIDSMQDSDVVLLENTRMTEKEEANDEEFAKYLASFADIFVNDAFGSAHRAHASTEGVAHYLPAVSGFLIEKELKFLGEALQNPERPFVSILGGSKVSDKIGVIDSLLEKVDVLLIGGGMAYTFYKALGYKIGNSICEDDKIDLAKELMKKAEEKGVKMLLPIDNKLGKEFSANTETMYADRESIPDGWEGLDIGPKTIELYAEELRKAKTVIWNGTVGVAEFEIFATGTNELAKVLADLDATTIIGGGDTAAAIQKAGVADKMTHVSTGGGASLEFIEGKKLPGIECLLDK